MSSILLALSGCLVFFAAQRRYLFAVVCSAVVLISSSLVPSEFCFVKRCSLLAYVFVPVLLGCWIAEACRRRCHLALAGLLVFTFHFLYPQCDFWPVTHAPAEDNISVAIADHLQTLPGRGAVLLEDVAHILDSPAAQSPPPLLHHYQSQVMIRCPSKRYVNNIGFDPHPYHVFRETIVDGTFEQESIGRYSLEDIREYLDRWGVEYLVLWSEASKELFATYRECFLHLKDIGGFKIFHYAKCRPSFFVFDDQASAGRIIRENWVSKEIAFHNLKQGQRVVLKMNYFPLWKGYDADSGAIVLFEECEGQLSFESPVNGDLDLRMEFPAWSAWLVVALVAGLILSVLTSRRGARSAPDVSPGVSARTGWSNP